MDTTNIKYFIMLAQTQHMTKAAQLLHITQPTLSASIRRLEIETGFQLFDRAGRGIQLNEYGKIFLEGALAAEGAINSCLAEMEERRRSSVSFVRIACSISPINSRLIDLLLSKGLSLKVDNIQDNWEHELINGFYDLVITMGRTKHTSIDDALLHFRKVVIVAGKDHPLAQAKTVSVNDLRQYPFCSTSAPHSLSNLAKEQLQVYDFDPHITFLCRDSADMAKALRTGKYLGLMGEHNLPIDEDLTALPVENIHLLLPIFLYWRRSDSKNSSIASTRRMIIDYYQDPQPIPGTLS